MKTAECVTPKHPDKLCDRISDAILDECLRQDPDSRVAVETMGGHGIITITGEVTTSAFFNAQEIAHRIAGENYGVQTNIVKQSREISQGVDVGGAGDQGVMVGYACDENDAMIPHELYLARSLCKKIYERFPVDGKTQITLNNSNEIETIVASFQNTTKRQLETEIQDWLEKNFPDVLASGIKKLCNPAGEWSQGGFEADTGLTGRKLAIDNYGTRIRIGGGAFSGKDATKVDRSAAYKARQIAVKTLKKEDLKECFVELAYAIGYNEPVAATIWKTKRSNLPGDRFTTVREELQKTDFEFSPKGIIESLKLTEPIFEKTAKWGHFGNNFIWEK